jgi:hypothetical protein
MLLNKCWHYILSKATLIPILKFLTINVNDILNWDGFYIKKTNMARHDILHSTVVKRVYIC